MTDKPQEKGEYGLTLDEHFILDACIFAATEHEIANTTGISAGRVKRMLTVLRVRGLVEANVYPIGKTTRKVWTRIGPED